MTNIDDIDFGDLQGLFRFAHAQLSEARFLLLKVSDAQAARDWLRSAPVSTAAGADPLPEQALQVAFTAPGLQALGVSDSVLSGFSEPFIAGMAGDENRSRRLGDTGKNSPAGWAWGGSSAQLPDLVLMLYTLSGGIDAWQAEVQGQGFSSAFTELAPPLDSVMSGPEEPFGFVDGISQPTTDWSQQVSTDLHERDRYSNLLALGEVVLGYPNEYGLYTDRPLIDPAGDANAQLLPVARDQSDQRDLGCNGSYMVLRQLEQDVVGFWKFIDKATGSDEQQREELAAAMVGRRRDGSPLAQPSRRPIAGSESDAPDGIANHFTFDDDPHGQLCPIGAHIRRSNPRTGDFPPGVTGLLSRLVRILGFGQRHPRDDLVASARFHRVLRRGRAYGPVLPPEKAIKPRPAKAERGLKFVCLGANLSRQFEFVQNAWSMSSKFAGLPTESDPLLGNRQPLNDGTATDRFTRPQAGAPAQCVEGLPQFVTVRGGAYFFMPGIRALQYIAGPPATPP